MIDIKSLTFQDMGKQVKYTGALKVKQDLGVLHSWDNKYVYVIYDCGSVWEKHEDFKGIKTLPVDLEFRDEQYD